MRPRGCIAQKPADDRSLDPPGTVRALLSQGVDRKPVRRGFDVDDPPELFGALTTCTSCFRVRKHQVLGNARERSRFTRFFDRADRLDHLTNSHG